MKKSEHTPGPWRVIPDEDLVFIDSQAPGQAHLVARFNSGNGSRFIAAEANAARVVACVNACAGIANPKAVPELLAALKAGLGSTCQAEAPASPNYGTAPCGHCSYCLAVAAIAKAEEEDRP